MPNFLTGKFRVNFWLNLMTPSNHGIPFSSILSDFFFNLKKPTDHQTPIRRPDLVIVNKNEEILSDWFYRPSTPQSENQRKWKERWALKPCRWNEKKWNMKVRIITVAIGSLRTIPKGLIKELKTYKPENEW